MGLCKLESGGQGRVHPIEGRQASWGSGQSYLAYLFFPLSSFPSLTCLLKAYDHIYNYQAPLSMGLLKVPDKCPPNPSHHSRSLSGNLVHPRRSPA